MKPMENIHDYFGRLNKNNIIIMDAYDTFTILPEEPAHNYANQVDLLEMTAYVRQPDLNLTKFFLLNHFRAGLPTEFGRVLNLQNQDKLRLSKAVKLTTNEGGKGGSKVHQQGVHHNHF
jgi:hypothetical protein